MISTERLDLRLDSDEGPGAGLRCRRSRLPAWAHLSEGGAIRQTGTEGGGEGREDPTRRTHLANERTYLAWWRSGLTALAVAVGVGRLVPQLGNGDGGTGAVSAVAGVGFGLLGLFFIVYAGVRARSVRRALERREFSHPDGRVLAVVGIAGTLLGGLTIAIVLEGL